MGWVCLDELAKNIVARRSKFFVSETERREHMNGKDFAGAAEQFRVLGRFGVCEEEQMPESQQSFLR